MAIAPRPLPDLLPVLDLWCGTCSAVEWFRRRGHPIISVDNDPQFDPTICKDILEVTIEELMALAPHGFAFAWASPDCRIFSLMNMAKRHWVKEGEWAIPQTEEARLHIQRVKHTIALLEGIECPYWILENPRAMLRKQRFMSQYQRITVSYCRYGDNRMKPTDLWGKIPLFFEPAMCENGNPDHNPAPRGSYTGTQGMSKRDAGMIPLGLSQAFYDAALFSKGQTIQGLDEWGFQFGDVIE